MTTTTTIPVIGMTCDGCEKSVSNAIRRLPGIEDVAADAATDQVKVSFNREVVTIDQIHASVGDAGFDVA